MQEREKFASDEDFWAKYSDEGGRRYNYQKITDTLQGTRVNGSDYDAAAALFFFDHDLTQDAVHGYFKYRRGRDMLYCYKPAKVAERWRKLLREHPDIAARWETRREEFEAQYTPA